MYQQCTTQHGMLLQMHSIASFHTCYVLRSMCTVGVEVPLSQRPLALHMFISHLITSLSARIDHLHCLTGVAVRQDKAKRKHKQRVFNVSVIFWGPSDSDTPLCYIPSLPLSTPPLPGAEVCVQASRYNSGILQNKPQSHSEIKSCSTWGLRLLAAPAS